MKDYKRILQGVVNIINITKKSDIGFANICSYIGENCPELKESEDEEIREALLEHIKGIESWEYFLGISKEQMIAWLEKQGTPAKLSEEEQNRFAKGVLTSCAMSFIDYLDAHKYEGKMCVSNGECEDIENAFHNAMWDRLHRYYCKYIEKQGEQKTVNKQKFKVGDLVKDTNHNKQPIYKVNHIDKECYICTSDDTTLGDKAVMHFAFDNPYLRLVAQKPAWSEEDRKNYRILQKIICDSDTSANLANKLSDWLKDLKERVQPQPKQEWSEEDEVKMREIISYLVKKKSRETDGYAIFLKSLKFRLLSPSIREFDKEEGNVIDHLIAICDDAMCYKTFAGCYDIEKCKRFLTNLKFGIDPQPQPKQWKPSDEQMKVLDAAVMHSHLTTAEYDGLVKLREQLKKLREE